MTRLGPLLALAALYGCNEEVTMPSKEWGALLVTTSSTGPDRPTGYELVVDGETWPLETTGELRVDSVPAGVRSVTLRLPPNCSAVGGPPASQLTIPADDVLTIEFEVLCRYREAIAYAIDELPNYENVMLLDPVTRLTWTLINQPTRTDDPNISPDGRFLAISTFRDLDTDTQWSIYLFDRDVASFRKLTDPESPDQRFPFDFEPRWAPDGRRIAFIRVRLDGLSTIMLVNADGTGLVDTGVSASNSLDWSPSGDEIVFERYAELHVMTIDGMAVRKLDGAAYFTQDVAWSPDGEHLAVIRARRDGSVPSQIWVLDRTGADVREVTTATDGGLHVALAWSPDGTRITYSMSSGATPDTWDLYMCNLDGSEIVRLTTNPAGVKVRAVHWR